MIRDAFGIIHAGEDASNLRDLITKRAMAALPFGGKYRAIDFPMSNMVNSEITNVGVITSRNYRSLMNHLGSGKEWDLSRKDGGLFVLAPFSLIENTGIYRGSVEALKGSMNYIRRSDPEYAVMSTTDFIYNTSFDEMMRFHINNNADITAMYYNDDFSKPRDDMGEDAFFNMDNDGRINSIEINPAFPNSSARSMKTYIIRKDLLIGLVEESYALGEYSFSGGLLRNNIEKYRIMGFEHKGYVGSIRSIESFYRVNMDLLDFNIRKELLSSNNRIFTRVKDSVPAKYLETANVSNSLIANECIIEGKVEGSILFRKIRVRKDAVIKNSIIFSGAEIGSDSELENVILDKNVTVKQGCRLVGSSNFPIVIGKGGVV